MTTSKLIPDLINFRIRRSVTNSWQFFFRTKMCTELIIVSTYSLLVIVSVKLVWVPISFSPFVSFGQSKLGQKTGKGFWAWRIHKDTRKFRRLQHSRKNPNANSMLSLTLCLHLFFFSCDMPLFISLFFFPLLFVYSSTFQLFYDCFFLFLLLCVPLPLPSSNVLHSIFVFVCS